MENKLRPITGLRTVTSEVGSFGSFPPEPYPVTGKANGSQEQCTLASSHTADELLGPERLTNAPPQLTALHLRLLLAG